MAEEVKVYRSGHVKRNADSGEVAIRTTFPEDQGDQLASLAWLVATKNVGARNAKTSDVEGWDDLFEPTPPPVPSE